MLEGYKTIIVAVILGIYQVYNAVSPDVALPDSAAAGNFVDVLNALITPVAMVIMRWFTKTPVGG